MATYTDFFNDFTAHPDTHDLAMKTDSRAIQQSLRNIVLTNTWERPYSRLGGSVRQLLFAEASPQIANSIKKKLEEQIANYEKRVLVEDINVKVNPEGRRYDIWITYFELNNPKPTTFYIELKRTR